MPGSEPPPLHSPALGQALPTLGQEQRLGVSPALCEQVIPSYPGVPILTPLNPNLKPLTPTLIQDPLGPGRLISL